MERIETFNQDTINALQTSFFNKIKVDAANLGIDLNIGDVTHDGFNFKTLMVGTINSEEAAAAAQKVAKKNLADHGLKLGDRAYVWNHIRLVSGFDDSKYSRKILLTDDTGKVVAATPEMVHAGIAEVKELATKYKKGEAPKRAAPAAKKTQSKRTEKPLAAKNQTKPVEEPKVDTPNPDAGNGAPDQGNGSENQTS